MVRVLMWLALTGVMLAGCSSAPPQPGQSADLDHPLRRQLLEHYREWAGTPYRYGGQDPSGVDCSGLIQRIFIDLNGTRLPRTTEALARVGREVQPHQLQPADLVFFKTGWRQRHAGIYIGNGEFIHASTSGGVMISRLDNPYWQDSWWMARRLQGFAQGFIRFYAQP